MDPKHTTPRADYEWSDEQTKQAVELFRGGQTALEISIKIGCTRNAVIGKMGRLGEKSPNRSYVPRIHGERKAALETKPKARPNMQTISARAARKRPLEVIPPMLVVRHTPRQYVAPKATRKTLQGLKERDCRWPCGDVGQPGFFFCGAPQVDGRVYCATHCAVAYRP